MMGIKPNVINDRRAVAALGRKKGSLSISSYPLNLSRSPSPRFRGHFFSPGRRSKEDHSPSPEVVEEEAQQRAKSVTFREELVFGIFRKKTPSIPPPGAPQPQTPQPSSTNNSARRDA